MIADLVAPGDRGRAIGTNDSFAGAAAIVLPLLGGPIVEVFGLPAIALISTGLMLIPFVMLLRLDESRWGRRRAAAERHQSSEPRLPTTPVAQRE